MPKKKTPRRSMGTGTPKGTTQNPLDSADRAGLAFARRQPKKKRNPFPGSSRKI